MRYMHKAVSARGKYFGPNGKPLEDFKTAYYYQELLKKQDRGEIAMLRLNPDFPYYHGRELLWVYTPAMSYYRIDKKTGERLNRVVVEVLPGHYYSRPWADPMVAAFMATNPDTEMEVHLNHDNNTASRNFVQRRASGLKTFREKLGLDQ